MLMRCTWGSYSAIHRVSALDLASAEEYHIVAKLSSPALATRLTYQLIVHALAGGWQVHLAR